MLFDSHAHYDDERFDGDRDETLKKVFESGVSYIINASSDLGSVEKSLLLAEKYEFVYAAVGIHPHNVGEADENVVTLLTDAAKNAKVVAIGEIGLDYYYDTCPRDMQKYWFAKQINLARSLGLPVIVHDRDAHEDSLKIIRSEKAGDIGGVFHCFSGSVEMAKVLLDNNFYISFSGSVTFKNARRLAEAAEFIPEDRLLIETDCPYMTPEPFRGKRNDSGYLHFTAERIAKIRGMDYDRIREITTENAIRLFKIDRRMVGC